MHVACPGMPIVIATDWRTGSDAQLDLADPKRGPHVLHLWKLGREALGKGYYRTTRVALFDQGDTPSQLEVTRARLDLRHYIEANKPAIVFILPTPDAQMGEGASALTGTACWTALQPPDNLQAMRLTRWQRGKSEVVAGYPIARRAKQLQVWAMAKALQRFMVPTLCPFDGKIVPDGQALHMLWGMTDRPLAIDLEFVPGRDLITAVNLSDGVRSVSLPWHAYTPRGHEEPERALVDHSQGPLIADQIARLLAAPTPKYCHNFVADVPLLRRNGLPVGGTVCDTFAAHAIAFPELPHGLQTAAASVLPVPPWKSEYKPRNSKGLNRDDEEYWMADPEALREYGLRDAFYTWHLAKDVLPRVGINPQTGSQL